MTSDRDRNRPRLELLDTGHHGASPASYEPARLTRARVLAGRSTAELAEMIGASETDIERYETGAAYPSDRLAELASALSMPVEHFASGRPMVRLDRADIHFRSTCPTQARTRARAAAYLEQLWELVHVLGRRVRIPEPDLPPGCTDITPADAARRTRQHWHLPRGPLAHLGATMESHGIIIWPTPSTDEAMAELGTYSTAAPGRPFVAVTADDTRSVLEYRFACAHELGHLLLHPSAAPGDRRRERDADRFATELLLPQQELEPLLPRRPGAATLSRLAEQWGVPTRALLQRAGAAGPTAPDDDLGEPLNSYPGEVPSLLREATKLSRQRGFDTTGLADELHCDHEFTRRLLGLEDARPRLGLVR